MVDVTSHFGCVRAMTMTLVRWDCGKPGRDFGTTATTSFFDDRRSTR
jgi:hypothetical protein